MKDTRIAKIKQHYDIFINDLKYKVIAFNINEEESILTIKTKIKGQAFPLNGQFHISIPSKKHSKNIQVEFKSMSSDVKIEIWEYTIL